MTQIEEIQISKLTLLDNNPRRISKDQMDKLIKSIKEDKEFLWCRPVLVNHLVASGVFLVYAGNQRVLAAKKLKWKTIPCIFDLDVPEYVMNKRMILDNKSMGEWDFDLLANTQDIDLLLDCGFQDFELQIDTTGKSIDEVLEEEKEKDKVKKEKNCPHCGGCLTTP